MTNINFILRPLYRTSPNSNTELHLYEFSSLHVKVTHIHRYTSPHYVECQISKKRPGSMSSLWMSAFFISLYWIIFVINITSKYLFPRNVSNTSKWSRVLRRLIETSSNYFKRNCTRLFLRPNNRFMRN